MKNLLRTLMIVCVVLLTKSLHAQSCSPSFVYTLNPGGSVTFSASSAITGTSISYYWMTTGGGAAYAFSGVNPTYAYTANGIYTITLSSYVSSPTCSATISQTIAVSGVTCSIAPYFTYQNTANGSQTFINYTTGAGPGATYFWTFSDNTTANGATPVHTFPAYGMYQATVVVTNTATPCSATYTLNINNNTCASGVNITYSLNPNGNIIFYANSTLGSPLAQYSWIAGGSMYTATGTPTISVTYTASGNYFTSVLLSVGGCTTYAQQTFAITNSVVPCNLNANFNYNSATSAFNNLTTGVSGNVSYSWNFGDNSSSSTSLSPVHTYSAYGSYLVTLTANNNYTPACISTKTLMVTYNTCVGNTFITFTANPNGNVIMKANPAQSGPSTQYFWSFGNNATYSATGSPTALATYSNGTYFANVLVVNGSCTTSAVQVFSVTNSCVFNAAFSLNPTGTPLYWSITPSANNIVSALWSWGDGSTSNTLYTLHTYSVAGTYFICLSATVSCGASGSYCSSSTVFRASNLNQTDAMVYINVVDPNAVGIKTNTYDGESAISPNPNNGRFTLDIKGLDGDCEIQVFDLTGKVILQEIVRAGSSGLRKEIDLENAPNGNLFPENKFGATGTEQKDSHKPVNNL